MRTAMTILAAVCLSGGAFLTGTYHPTLPDRLLASQVATKVRETLPPAIKTSEPDTAAPSELRARLFAAQEQWGHLQTERYRLIERNRDLTDEVAALKADVAALERKVETKTQRVSLLESSLDAAMARSDKLREKIGEMKKVPAKARKVNAATMAEATALREQIRLQRHLRDIMAHRTCDLVDIGPDTAPTPQAPQADAGKNRLNHPTDKHRSRFADALMAYECENYTAAFANWFALAKDGHPRAKFHVGGMLHEGRGVESDKDLAIAWLEEAKRDGVDVAGGLLDEIDATRIANTKE